MKLRRRTFWITDAKVWALASYIASAAGTFGTMARAFGWL